MTYESCGNIASKSDLSPGIYTYGHSTKPFAVTGINSGNQAIPSADQVATYTSFEQVSTIEEDDYYATFTYNSDNQRCKMLITDLGSTILTRWYVGSRYIKEDDNGTTTEYTWIGGDAYSAPIVAETVGSTTSYYYLLRDYLGNITHKVNTSNTVTAEYSYDAWGRRRDKDDWSYTLSGEPDLTAGRGFTSHEYLACFNIVNMNGRLYDPLVGRFLSPDENVQMPDFTQNFNRYSYCLNNPLIYTDPSGEIVWAPIIIGAIVGAYMGGTIANEGNYNPVEWDYNSGQTWGYMLGGAVVGGLSGYVGGAIAASEIPMANTLGIMGASLTNSIGTNIYTGGQTDISVSFGIGSYNFSNNTWGGIWNWSENSTLENIGYSFGTLANLSDAVSLFSGGGKNVDINSASTKDDWWGHSSMTDENGKTLVSVGPDTQVQKAATLSDTWKNSIKGAKLWDSYVADKGTWSIRLNNVSTSAINNYASGITRWDLLLNSCVGHTTRALMRAGVPTIYAFHPHMLNLQLLIRQVGIYSSPYLYQITE